MPLSTHYLPSSKVEVIKVAKIQLLLDQTYYFGALSTHSQRNRRLVLPLIWSFLSEERREWPKDKNLRRCSGHKRHHFAKESERKDFIVLISDSRWLCRRSSFARVQNSPYYDVFNDQMTTN